MAPRAPAQSQETPHTTASRGLPPFPEPLLGLKAGLQVEQQIEHQLSFSLAQK